MDRHTAGTPALGTVIHQPIELRFVELLLNASHDVHDMHAMHGKALAIGNSTVISSPHPRSEEPNMKGPAAVAACAAVGMVGSLIISR